jgi:hypothetical protein
MLYDINLLCYIHDESELGTDEIKSNYESSRSSFDDKNLSGYFIHQIAAEFEFQGFL